VLVVSFSGSLDAGPAQGLGAYHLVAAGKDKKVGTKDDKNLAIASASYDPAAHTVTLTPRGKVPSQAVQLTITAAALLDAHSQPIDGNRDGRPGGDYTATGARGGISLAGTRAEASGLSGRILAEAVDALVVMDQLLPPRGRRSAERSSMRIRSQIG
jgi:hypothetical protein